MLLRAKRLIQSMSVYEGIDAFYGVDRYVFNFLSSPPYKKVHQNLTE